MYDEVFHRFAKALDDRFSRGRFTTEDSVRYTLFHCLVRHLNVDPSDIILEFHHPRILGAGVDAYIVPRNGRLGLAFEFKFDRKIPSGRNLPRPQKAGKVFADIFRLALVKVERDVQLFFVYVTDGEMAGYLRNPSNQLADFFNMMPGQHLTINKHYVGKYSATFVKAAGNNIVDCEAICRLNREFSSGFWLRIYEIRQDNRLKSQ